MFLFTLNEYTNVLEETLKEHGEIALIRTIVIRISKKCSGYIRSSGNLSSSNKKK